jgi:hypothetical protein
MTRKLEKLGLLVLLATKEMQVLRGKFGGWREVGGCWGISGMAR